MSKKGKVCEHCGKPLVAIGYDRANGINQMSDYDERRWHKKCFKILAKSGQIRWYDGKWVYSNTGGWLK